LVLSVTFCPQKTIRSLAGHRRLAASGQLA
jgi:hypothetical protein